MVFVLAASLFFAGAGCHEQQTGGNPGTHLDLPADIDSNLVANAQLIWQDNATSGARLYQNDDNRICVFEEHRYHLADGSLVISERVNWTFISGTEGNHSQLEAEAYRIDDQGRAASIWTIAEEADKGELWNWDYRTVEYGCCDAIPLYRLHRLTDGKNYLTYDMAYDNFEFKRQPGDREWERRQVASRCYFSGPESWPVKDPMPLGVVYFATEDSILHTLLVVSRDSVMYNDFYYWPYDIAVVSIDSAFALARKFPDSCRVSLNDLTAPARAIEFAAILGSFGSGPVLVVPIEGDDFLIERPRFRDFEIIRVN